MNELNTDWHPEKMLEIQLKEPDDFLKVRETLTRIGVASRKDKKLFQSCHILHKQGRYFIVHFKELFALDGKKANLSDNDLERRNTIAQLLGDWGLVVILNTAIAEKKAPLSQIKVLSFKEKGEWDLQAKYNIGKKAEPETVKEPEPVTEPEPVIEPEPESEPETVTEPELVTEEITEELKDESTEV